MENLIYPDPTELTFDLENWKLGDTMFKDCTIRVPNIPSTTQSLEAPRIASMRKLDDMVNVVFNVDTEFVFRDEDKFVHLKLFSFPVDNIEARVTGDDTGFTLRAEANTPNELATELSLGKLTMASILEYEPITRRLPGNVNTADIKINIQNGIYSDFQCEMNLYPAPGVILKLTEASRPVD